MWAYASSYPAHAGLAYSPIPMGWLIAEEGKGRKLVTVFAPHIELRIERARE